MIWVIMCVAPVENDKHEIPLYLILFYDISPLRQPLDDETLSGSKFFIIINHLEIISISYKISELKFCESKISLCMERQIPVNIFIGYS